MATSKEYLNFVLEQLSDLQNITYRSMMGEYIVYYNKKIAAYLCDNRMLVKISPCAEKMLPNAKKEPPYEGAKDMLLVENIDDKDFLKDLFVKIYSELPAKKSKPKR